MRDSTPPRWRDSPRVIVADYLNHLPTTAVIVAGLWAFGARSSGVFGTALAVLSIGYLAVAVIEPVFRQATHHYEVTDGSLRHDTGLIERRTRDFPWNSIAAVNIEQPWAHKLLGIHRLTLTQAGGESTRVVLRGATRTTVDLVLSRVESAPASADVEEDEAARERDEERAIYSASTTDLVMMGFVHGQVLVLAIAGVATVWELLEGTGLLEPLGLAAGRFPVWSRVIAAVFLAGAIGVVATVVRYHRFRVRVGDRGQLLIRFGILESQERRIDPAAVAGMVVHRNLIEQVTGRARLALLTTDSAAQLRSNLLLPSLPVGVVQGLATLHFPDLVPSDSLLDRRPRRAAALLLSLGVLGLSAGVGASLGRWTVLPVWADLLAALGVFVAASMVGRSLSTRFSGEEPRVLTHATTRFVAERQTTLRSGAVGQVVSVNWLRPGPVLLCASLGAYAGRPLRFTAILHPRSSIDGITRQVLSACGDERRRPQPWGFSR